jgi:GT2 family glycosyltransferase
VSVSLIVPVHDKTHRLRLALAGIRGQHNFGDFELIIVADRPGDGVRELLAALNIGRVVESPGVGRAGARNCGAHQARGELLVFMDDDILIEHDFMSAHLQAQAACSGLVHGRLREIIGLYNVADPALGGPGCPPISSDELVAGRWRPGPIRLVANRLEQAAEHSRAVHWPWLASAGANISISRALWQQVGGFDDIYGTRWGMEDIDFAYRLWRAGVPISLAPEACGYHMSHVGESRWDEHRLNLSRFQRMADCPEALALDELLSPTGSLDKYIQRVDQIRQTPRPAAACAYNAR